MGKEARRPLVGIPCCVRRVRILDYHVVGEKYARAIARATGALPVLVPAMADELELHEILGRLDGVFFTGSPSNVEPRHYDGPPSRDGVMHDPRRDALTLPLIRMAIETGVPLVGVCRGYQEINVALGGSLHQHVQEVDGMLDHREDPALPRAAQYEPAHGLTLADGGLLATLAGGTDIAVNSLHTQGVNELAPPLTAEAWAPDGLVEAFRVTDAPGFTLGMQWHPEWEIMDNPLSVKIFAAFGEAIAAHARARDADPARRAARPLVGLPCDVTQIGIHPFEAVADLFLTAVHDAADCLPVGIPVLPGEMDYDALLDQLDGVFLCGGASMVHPKFYGEEPFEDEMILDETHDEGTLPLIRAAVEKAVPLLGVCRGIQEINVAYGGTLHQEITRTEGMLDHHPNIQNPILDKRFAPAHEMIIEPGSLLAELTGESRATINSAHRQGIKTVGHGLAVEARAPDGLVEAVRIEDAPGFAYGVQSHPEHKWREKPYARALFGAFGEAVRKRAAERAARRARAA